MIEVKDLNPWDIGRKVSYRPRESGWEFGVLSSVREDGAIFVKFKGPTGERCEPKNLFWELDV